MATTILANLPTTSEIDPASYVIIERPGIGKGTYKSTVGDLQEAITVHAKVTQDGDMTTIEVQDINGTTTETIVTPTANVTQEGDITTIRIHDYLGTTEHKIVTPTANVSQIDDVTTISIHDYLGTTEHEIVTPTAKVEQDGLITTISIHDKNGTTTGTVVTPTAKVTREGKITYIDMTDVDGATHDEIVTPKATITDNGDNTATIRLEDTDGITEETIVSRVQLDDEPTEGSPNLLTSGTIYNLQQGDDGRLSDLETRLSIAETELAEARSKIARFEQRLSALENVSTRVLVTEEGQFSGDEFLSDGVQYDTLKDAILAASSSQGIVQLLSDATSEGIAVPENGQFTLDLNGHELLMVGPGAGSKGTETNGMQLLKGSDITIKNGVINFNDPRLKMGIQNYSNLTLDNVQITGSSSIRYVVSNNFGNVIFKNGTTITAEGNNVAFDCWYGMSSVYDNGVNITIEDSSVVINGKVEFGKAARASLESFRQHASITCPHSMNLHISLLTGPCSWFENGDGTKTLRYSG